MTRFGHQLVAPLSVLQLQQRFDERVEREQQWQLEQQQLLQLVWHPPRFDGYVRRVGPAKGLKAVQPSSKGVISCRKPVHGLTINTSRRGPPPQHGVQRATGRRTTRR
nr:MAG TPA: hypothetical protein [Caudoviricetes sp.]